MTTPHPSVDVVIPVLNEENALHSCKPLPSSLAFHLETELASRWRAALVCLY